MCASPQALAAVRAAKNFKRWGSFAAAKFLFNRGVPLNMIQHAVRIERIKRSKRMRAFGRWLAEQEQSCG